MQITCAEPLGGLFSGLTNKFGGGALGLGGGTNAVQNANGAAGSLLGLANDRGVVAPVGAILNQKVQCLPKCPTTIANTDLKCVASGTFPSNSFCYGENSDGKTLYPCNPKRKKVEKDD